MPHPSQAFHADAERISRGGERSVWSPPDHDEDRRAWRTWRAAAADSRIDAALRGLYADVDHAIATREPRPPRCDASGRCCDFYAHGHRLYVTGLEIAWFLRHAPRPTDWNPSASRPHSLLPQLPTSPGVCPYQRDRLCTTHTIRPLGCRIYFCEPGTDEWQHALYEDFLKRLQRLHDAHALPYRYMEWLAGLDEADAAGVGNPDS